MQSAVEIIKKNAIRTCRHRSEDALLFSTSVAGKGYTCYFTIYPKLLRKTGFTDGDRVDLLFDPATKTGRIVPSERGRQITRANQSASKKVQFSWSDGMPSVAGVSECYNVTAKPGQIDFNFPKTTSFNGVARENV